MSTAPSLEAHGLKLVYPNGTEALRGVAFSLTPGEFVAIVGTSGCGKSTLLRLCAGLEQPSGGGLTVNLESSKSRGPSGSTGFARPQKPDPSRVSFVFQHPNLLPWRTVMRNVCLPLELSGTRKGECLERARGVLDQVGLADFTDAYPHQLSGGMSMRVSVARALITRPRLLLMDEPFGALDEITRERLHEDLLALWQTEQFTVLFVTHNMFEAVFLAQRVLVMSPRPGHIQARVQVPFPYPRRGGLRGEAEFARVVGEVGGCLRSVSV